MQSPNPYPQYPQPNPYAQPPQPNPYPQYPQPNPYPQQPQANPSPQQPQTQDYLTRNGIGKRFWFVSRPDNNGCNFALLSYSFLYIPVYFFGRYYVKFEGKKSSTSSGPTVYFSNGQAVNASRNTSVVRVTTFYRTPLILKEILLLYAFLLSIFVVALAPIFLTIMSPDFMLQNPMVLGIGTLIWLLMVPAVLMVMYESYTHTGTRHSKGKK